tara:strand:- start:4 stop:222 length:219 start_codon:yes stop_codon:yes gene_type:complete
MKPDVAISKACLVAYYILLLIPVFYSFLWQQFNHKWLCRLCYLALITDMHSRKLVGYVLRELQKMQLIYTTK